MNAKIHEFSPQIYPTRLWVAKSWEVPYEELKDYFYASNIEDGLVYDFEEQFGSKKDLHTFASTYPVGNKESKWRGCLVYIWKRNTPLSIFAHEASHCTDWLFESLGIVQSGFNDGEPRAYYVQWVFDKIYNVIKRKE